MSDQDAAAKDAYRGKSSAWQGLARRKPRLLDLFAGAGGAARGYQQAGFYVVGVDIKPQPRYAGDLFIQGDALDPYVWNEVGELDAIHASPPCQAYSTTKWLHGNEYPDLIEAVRQLLRMIGLPYVIENVVGAPVWNRIQLCGSSFGLGVRRHRVFEVFPMPAVFVPPCAHYLQPAPLDVTGTGGPGGRHRKPKDLTEARRAMGIDWMTRPELSEAVPPAYTEWIGYQLIEALERTTVAERLREGWQES